MAADARAARLQAALRTELADLIAREVRDPRVVGAGLLTVTEVRLSPDRSSASVWVSVLGAEGRAAADPGAVIAGLASAAGYLRGAVGRRLGLRRAPELRFELDRSGERAQRVDELLREDAREHPRPADEHGHEHEAEGDGGEDA